MSPGSLNSFAAGSPLTPAVISALPGLQCLPLPLWVCSPGLRLGCGRRSRVLKQCGSGCLLTVGAGACGSGWICAPQAKAAGHGFKGWD